MQNFIYHIRKQPEHVKRHILHVTTVVCGVILVSLWVFSLGTNLASTETQTKIGQDLKPLSALKANLIGGYNSISGSTDIAQ